MLYNFRTPREAVESVILPWIDSVSTDAVTGKGQAWLVVPHLSHGWWIKSELISRGKSFAGIDIVTPGTMRKRLCNLLGVRYLPIGRESLHFLVQNECLNHSDPVSRAIVANPAPLLSAMDQLGRSGWAGDEISSELSPELASYLPTLQETPGWIPMIDQQIIEAAQAGSLKLTVMLYGWDSTHSLHYRLLLALKASASRFDLLAPMPRCIGDDPDAAWQDNISSWVGEEFEPIESDFMSPMQGFCDSLVSRSNQAPEIMPEILIGREWTDEAHLVARRVLEVCRENKSARVGVIVGKRSAITEPLLSSLREHGAQVFDESGAMSSEMPEMSAHRHVARLMEENGDVEIFIRLTDALWEIDGAMIKINPVKLRSLVKDGFGRAQSRDFRKIAKAIDPHFGGDSLNAFASLLEPWPRVMGWAEAKTRWEALVAALGLDAIILEPVWSRLDAVMEGREISSKLFFRYISSILSARPPQSCPDNDPYGQVVVTSLDRAAGQNWTHLVFTECNDGIWPVAPDRNPFLDDEKIVSLNQKAGERPRLLTSSHRSAIERRQVFDLIEGVETLAIFSAHAQVAGESGQPASPNEWVAQTLLLSESPLTIQDMAVSIDAGDATSSDFKALARVHESRRDPEVPFDEYNFNYGQPVIQPTWRASELDAAISTPATFALSALFESKSIHQLRFVRSENLMVGSLTHHLLELATNRLSDDPSVASIRASELIALVARETAESFEVTNTDARNWRGATFRKSVYFAERCLSQVLPLVTQYGSVSSECPLKGAITTPAGNLNISGRLDLGLGAVGSPAGNQVAVIDYKTGATSSFTDKRFAAGAGLQFLAYLGLLCDAGADHVRVIRVTPEASKMAEVNSDAINTLREHLARVASMQKSFLFGRSAFTRSEHGGAELLPMTSSPESPDMLTCKYGISNR